MRTANRVRGRMTHTLPRDALVGVDLPAETLDLLVRGVPAEVRLPDWAGPTLFSSEIGGGRLLSTDHADAAVPRTPSAGYEIGTVRETQGFPTAYGAFVLRPGTGEVWLVDKERPADDRLVNTSLAAFMTAIEAFRVAWPRLVDDDLDYREDFVAAFRALLERLDAASLADPEHYWPGWLEELEALG
jgi:hypothetical protein